MFVCTDADSSDGELSPKRTSGPTPGLVRLSSPGAFDTFGVDLKDVDREREEREQEWQRRGEKTASFSAEVDVESPTKRPPTIKEVAVKLDFDAETPNDGHAEEKDKEETVAEKGDNGCEGDAAEEEGKKVSTVDSPLARWKNMHSLNRIDQIESRPSVSPATTLQPPREETEPRVSGMVGRFEDRKNSGELSPPRPQQAVPQPPPEIRAAKASVAGLMNRGNVNDMLKMFGGGVKVKPARPAPKPSATIVHIQEEREEYDFSMSEAPKGSKKIDAVATTDHREAAKLETKLAGFIESTSKREPGMVESMDTVAPLPKIHRGLARRQSQERLRLDGLTSSSSSEVSRGTDDASGAPPGRYSPPGRNSPPMVSRGLGQEGNEKFPSPSARKKSGSSVYSPLIVSTDAQTAGAEKKGSEEKQAAEVRPTSQTSKDLALFMNSASLPHLNHLKERHEKEEREKAEKVVEALLREPRWQRQRIPIEFSGADFNERNKVHIWKQKVRSKITAVTC